MNKPSTELSILFLSCDKYSDLWMPLFHCVHKYFQNNEYSMYLGSNTKTYKNKWIKTLLSGQDQDWSTSLIKILDQITTPYIFLWLDDMFPIKKVSVARFTEVLAFMKSKKAMHVHVEPTPVPDKILTNGKFGEYTEGQPYRTIAMGFWEVAALKKLLIPGESPWNFEIMGSYRSSYIDGCYCAIQPIFTSMNVVEKGKIFLEASLYCQKHGIPLDVTKREVMVDANRLKSEIQKVIFSIMIKIPWKWRVSIMNVLRKIMVSY